MISNGNFEATLGNRFTRIMNKEATLKLAARFHFMQKSP